jgi:hypothetical protein
LEGDDVPAAVAAAATLMATIEPSELAGWWDDLCAAPVHGTRKNTPNVSVRHNAPGQGAERNY